MSKEEAPQQHDEPIIVKKIKKGHGGHHGGSWKVAYADFVTAMMAFFLLMWLTSMTSEEKKKGLGDYFQNYSAYQYMGLSPYKESSQTPPTDNKESGKEKKTDMLEVMYQKTKKEIEQHFKSLQDQIIMDFTSDGLRIQLIDKAGNPMFNSGSASVNNWSKEVLEMVSNNIKDLPNKIAIEGHTDSIPFASGNLSNWELSTARASAARKELEKTGIESDRFSKIVGYADTQPFVKYDTKDPTNRRINIILLRDISRPDLEK